MLEAKDLDSVFKNHNFWQEYRKVSNHFAVIAPALLLGTENEIMYTNSNERVAS